jgi:DNA-binding HxlR family transcriptional regulator
VRPGAKALSILSVPLNVFILKQLQSQPASLTELRRCAGSPPTTTMRVYLQSMVELGVVERHRREEPSGLVEYAITRAGRRLMTVGVVLDRWLRSAPEGPIVLGSDAAKSAVKALVEGWSANIVRALAARPLALVELSRFIPGVSYPALERRLVAMRLTGLVERGPSNGGRGTPHQITRWMRSAVAPLISAVSWEHVHIPAETVPIDRTDVEATFLLVVPLLDLPPELSGTSRLTVEIKGGQEPEFAGVSVFVDGGRVTSCVARLESEADAWASGTVLDWFRWVTRQEEHRIELGGDIALADAVADGLHGALIQVPQV